MRQVVHNNQVVHNKECRQRQYDLADPARQLGWSEVIVIEDDLGRFGGGTAHPGFEKLIAAICKVRVGAVISIDASRLARNGSWSSVCSCIPAMEL
ncbi:recombinase family protein [Bradyrhizobium diazoefficiens]|uniref:recombinase family protein n=1 Tax=Bradyrhizobium diazoefficiens TaxID=1355477 RepID=UPI00190D1F22|nr:recombinase family protein [Bradyrhizobium diazoefficiens]QQO35554.1 recombinase family protein [Bradyrhizobium diazoefficiens]